MAIEIADRYQLGAKTKFEFELDTDNDLPLLFSKYPPNGEAAITSNATVLDNDDEYTLRRDGWRKRGEPKQ